MKKYSNNKNVLMLLSLMKHHNIRKVIASPGTTNLSVVGSIQHDSYFEMYSSVDERSAAYMACGLASESGEPVAIICTSATASRNFLPGLTEAYYRKLPILVIAGSHGEEYIGHLHSQVIDRTQAPKDTVVYSAFINTISKPSIEWYNRVELNKAMIKLRQHGGGPVLVNLQAGASEPFGMDELPYTRAISLHSYNENLPQMPKGRVAIFVGVHVQMSDCLQKSIDDFCASRDAVVFCDHTSGYHGKYQVNFSLINCQLKYVSNLLEVDLLIHIGEVSGDTYTTRKLRPKSVWRVSRDGEVRDLFKNLDRVFEMDEQFFFTHYKAEVVRNDSYFNECKKVYIESIAHLPEFGFGNLYIAKMMAPNLPSNCVVHFGIYNSLRSWNMFTLDSSIQSSCNVGGFGIDGPCSTLIGASLANPNKLHFLFVGDLAFFYDLNSLGNRHVGNNVRILLINNGRGVEFRKKDHPGYRFGEEADSYIAAAGHFGNQSVDLVKNFVVNLGFNYLTASSKEEFAIVMKRFLTQEQLEKPLLMEVFPDYVDDVENLNLLRNSFPDNRSLIQILKNTTKSIIKSSIESILSK